MADVSISNITISSKRLVIGDKVTIGFTLKNTHPDKLKIDRVGFALYAKSTGSSYYDIAVARFKVQQYIEHLAYNASKSFEYSFTIEDGVNNPVSEITAALNANSSIRALPLALRAIVGVVGESSMSGSDFPISDAYIMRSRCNPTISKLELERALNGAANDEGINVLTTLQLGMADTSESGNMSLMMYYAQGTDPATTTDAKINLKSKIPTLLSGVTNDATIITDTFSNSSDWDFMLVFGDQYESVAVHIALFRAFANMHLSGASTGGVCYGGFSSSTEGNPKLESYYPAHLYAGVAAIGDGWTYLTPVNGSTPGTYGGGSLRCRAVENKRIIAGSLLVKPGSSSMVLAQLPDGYAPVSAVFSINACNGGRVARIGVAGGNEENSGKLVCSWVRNLSDGSVYTDSEIWVQCSIEYWVN